MDVKLLINPGTKVNAAVVLAQTHTHRHNGLEAGYDPTAPFD